MTEEENMKRSKVALIASLALTIVCVLAIAGCRKQEPIVGTREAPSGNQTQFNDDETFTYTNSKVRELGVLEGTWEKNEKLPETVEADGKTWTVYLLYEETRKVTGDGERSNKHTYNDKYGDYYLLVSGDQAALTIALETSKLSRTKVRSGLCRIPSCTSG